MKLAGFLRAKKLSKAITDLKVFYNSQWSDDEMHSWQLKRFNEVWNGILNEVPYFMKLYHKGQVPKQFNSWKEFIRSVPVMTREVIQQNRDDLYSKRTKPDFFRMTGGTTARPIQLPAWKSEISLTVPDMWYARSWYGVTPASKLFLLWGHSHLLGSGIKGIINANKRNVSDRLLGYRRFSAYNLDEKSMRKAACELVRFKPEYVIGYSVALDAFARANQDRSDMIRELNLKVVIAAAEGFPASDSESLISKTFGCPLSMEYGSVETFLMGHKQPQGGYFAVWGTYFIEATDKGGHGRIVRVTSLFPRCFPLVRYEIGDEIELYDGQDGLGVLKFVRVIGRCNDYICMRDNSKIHSEGFTHAIRSCPYIKRYQIKQEADKIVVKILVNEEFTYKHEAEIREKLAKIHPDLGSVRFEKTDRFDQTIAGKTPMIIRGMST